MQIMTAKKYHEPTYPAGGITYYDKKCKGLQHVTYKDCPKNDDRDRCLEARLYFNKSIPLNIPMHNELVIDFNKAAMVTIKEKIEQQYMIVYAAGYVPAPYTKGSEQDKIIIKFGAEDGHGDVEGDEKGGNVAIVRGWKWLRSPQTIIKGRVILAGGYNVEVDLDCLEGPTMGFFDAFKEAIIQDCGDSKYNERVDLFTAEIGEVKQHASSSLKMNAVRWENYEKEVVSLTIKGWREVN